MEKKTESLSISIGHFAQVFNGTLYGYFAFFLADVFFPAEQEEWLRLAASYAAFAVGLLAQPLGALFIGFLGDTKGLRKALRLSVALMGIPTLAIALTPSFESIGILAPIAIILFRACQGFVYGIEYVGATMHSCDTAESESKRSAKSARMVFIGFGGAMLAMLLSALLNIPSMPNWSWRLIFVFGGFFAFVAYFTSKSKDKDLAEAAESRLEIHSKKQIFAPLMNAFNNRFRTITGSVIAGISAIPLFSATVFGNSLLHQSGLSHSAIFLVDFFILAQTGLFIYLFGLFFSKMNFKNTTAISLVITGVLALCSAFPLIGYSLAEIPPLNAIVFVAILSSASGPIGSWAMPYVHSLFNSKYRLTESALSVTLGYAVIGGLTPNICLYLEQLRGVPHWMEGVPAILFLFILPMIGLGLFMVRKVERRTSFLTKSLTLEQRLS
ncbi:MAG: MFS transporter [Holosporales bacterium]